MSFLRTHQLPSAFVARGLGSVLQLVLTFLLARLLGAHGIGIYQLFANWTYLFATVISGGLPTYALRETAFLYSANAITEARRLIFRAIKFIVLWGAVVGAITLLAVNANGGVFSDGLSFVVELSVAAGVLLALLRLFAEIAKAQGRAVVGLLLEFGVVPALIIVSVIGWGLLQSDAGPTAVILAHVAGLLVAVTIAASATLRGPAEGQTGQTKIKTKSVGTLWGISLVNNGLAAAPYLVLPLYAMPSEIGLFGVAHRLIGLSGTILMALASIYASRFSIFANSQDIARLKHAFRNSWIYSLACFLPFFLGYSLFGTEILGFFGDEFAAAAPLLLVMALGRLVGSAVGLSEQLLSMVGKEHWELLSAALSLCVFFTLSAIFAPIYGPYAIAWSIAIAHALRAVISRSCVGWYFAALRHSPQTVCATRGTSDG